MNKKGFALFTPLLGMMLVLITATLIINMQGTEEVRIQEGIQIRATEETGDLISSIRADALQSVIAGTREAYFNFLNGLSCEDGILINEKVFKDNASWEEIQNDFIEKDLISQAGIISRISGQVSSKLKLVNARLPFHEKFLTFQGGAPGIWRKVMEDTLTESGRDSYRIIDCESAEDCKDGSFYLILDTSLLSPDTIAGLPKLELEEEKESKVEPLLPINVKIPIYVQFRLFKALAKAKVFYDALEDPVNEQKLFGLPGDSHTRKINAPMLGVCDLKKCSTRFDPWSGEENTCVDSFDGSISGLRTKLKDKDAKVPYGLCPTKPDELREIDFSQGFDGRQLTVYGKYMASDPERAVAELEKLSFCTLAADVMAIDDKMGPIPDQYMNPGTERSFIGCGGLSAGGQYTEQGFPQEWSVNDGPLNVQGLGFPLSKDNTRITAFDAFETVSAGSRMQWKTKRVCAETCESASLTSAIGLPQEFLTGLGDAATFSGGVWNRECSSDRLRSGINLSGEYTSCARPFTLQTMCMAFRDEKPTNMYGFNPVDFYFDIQFDPSSYEAAVADAKDWNDNALLEGSRACTADDLCGVVADNGQDYACVHGIVEDYIMLEYFPYPEYTESCAPVGYGPCSAGFSAGIKQYCAGKTNCVTDPDSGETTCDNAAPGDGYNFNSIDGDNFTCANTGTTYTVVKNGLKNKCKSECLSAFNSQSMGTDTMAILEAAQDTCKTACRNNNPETLTGLYENRIKPTPSTIDATAQAGVLINNTSVERKDLEDCTKALNDAKTGQLGGWSACEEYAKRNATDITSGSELNSNTIGNSWVGDAEGMVLTCGGFTDGS
ncbi:MAG: hypothetical protein GOV15_04140 [Candidatus Diapherotrites archaeon]|nr:hypothetical protein [Candidatus Diapherotrites archaeon]